MTTGYSGTPLVQKLGYKDGMRVWFDDMPDSVRAEIYAQELTLSEEEVPTSGINAAHIFVTERKALEEKLSALRQVIDPAGFIWVSWPKKGGESRDRYYRRHDPRDYPARQRSGRCEGLRGRCGLVGAEAGGAQRAALGVQPQSVDYPR